MCVIIAKNKNDRLPSIDELKNCFSNNKDGSGFMYTLNHNVIIDKGYMTETDFINRFKYLCKRFNNFDNKCLVIHCRIGTAGTNTSQNTHPYPITNDVKNLHKLYFKTSLGIAHNGIITSYNPSSIDNKNDINDTQNFILNYLYDLSKNYKQFYKSKSMLDGILNLTTSKFAILTKKDELITIGNFVNHNNLLFSNESYIKKTYTYYSYDYDFFKKYDFKNNWNTSKKTSYTHIPSSYYIFYGDEIFSNDNYYLNTDGDLLKLKNNKYEYITSDFVLYDQNWTLIDIDEMLGNK